MKKIFIALSVLMAIALGAGPSMAVVGTLDDVKGVDLFAPFFLVDRDLTAPQENTLLVLQEMGNRATAAPGFHIFFYDRNSNLIYTLWTGAITAYDVNQWYVSDWLAVMPAIPLAAFEVTVGGTNYYAGYIVMENPVRNVNHIGGWVYQVSLAAGRASCSKLPSREWAIGAAGGSQGLTGTYTAGTSYIPLAANVGSSFYQRESIVPGATVAPTAANTTDYEGFSANALAVASERAFGYVQSAPLAAVATWNLYPRYYLYNSTGATYFFIWTNKTPAAAYTRHVNVYDENENVYDVRIPLPNELNIINARDWISPAFITGLNDYGFFDIYWSATDTINPVITDEIRQSDWVVYSYQMATGPAAQSWNVLERGFATVGT